MMNKQWWIGLFMNRSIRTKIVICMLAISLLATVVTSYVFYAVSYRDHMAVAQSSAQIKVEAASTTVSDSVSTLYTNVFSTMETDELEQLFQTASNGGPLTANMLADTADSLNRLARTNSLIDAILLITSQGEYFSNKNIRLRRECRSVDMWEDHGDEIITWISARATPYVTPQKDILAVSFSFGYRKGVDAYIPRLVNGKENLTFRLFVFLDYSKLTSLLQSNDEDTLSITYLADASLRPLSMIGSAHFFSVAADEEFQTQALALQEQGEIALDRKAFLVHIGPELLTGLRIVHITSKQELLSGYETIIKLIYLSAMITILAAILLSAAMTRQLTRPLMKLVGSIRAIGKEKESKETFVPRYNDEIGVLGMAVANMRGTIDAQMQTIKEEERKRSQAEIRMLTQQINPHFIYNTLDCIRWEILNHNIEGSSGMVESLATFLRLGFGHEGDALSIKEEVTRVEQYLNIMGQRMNGSIAFSSYIDGELAQLQIPKMVLQPLAENSIKHGFSPDVFTDPHRPREIYISCTFQTKDSISLAVEDNGAGIDIQRAKAAVNLNEKDPSIYNIGLRNSYLRLRAFFGADNVTLHFSTTPFSLNRVEYVILLKKGHSGSLQ